MAGDGTLGLLVERDEQGRIIRGTDRLIGAFHYECWHTYENEHRGTLEARSCGACGGTGNQLPDEQGRMDHPHACLNCGGRGWDVATLQQR